MSAWRVTKGHIDCLVQALVVEEIVPMSIDKDHLGKMLWAENYKSVNYRYSERRRPPKYEFYGVEAPLDDLVVWKQASCYNYQTCEHPSYEESEAFRLIKALWDVYRARYGVASYHDLERREGRRAPWGITEFEEALK